MEINLGQYTLPVILAVVLGVIFKFAPNIKDKYKSLIAVVVGIAFGGVLIFYQGEIITFQYIVDRLLDGLMVGAAATGLYEVQRSVVRPRE